MNRVLDQLQILYEFSMAIGTSLELRVMLRKSISTILRKLNCQAGGIHFYKQIATNSYGLDLVFSIPRQANRIEEYQQLLDTFPQTFDSSWISEFTETLPRHIQTESGKHIYIFELPSVGFFILIKNEANLEPLLIKSFVPLFDKLSTACLACLQNQELIDHRNNLETLVQNKTNELVAQNLQLEQQILERIQAEADLRETEERYIAVVQQASEGIFLIDPDTKYVLDCNESFLVMLSYSLEELRALTAYDFVMHERSDIDAGIERVLNESEVFIGDRKYKDKHGNIIDVEASAKLIRYSGKKAILIVIRDTSEKKQQLKEKEKLKEQLRQAQKFEALGSLAGGVAHDLNNILSGIVGYPELMLQKLSEDSELRRPLERIHDSGKRATTIVADLLTIARSAASKKEVHNLNKLVQEYYGSPEHNKIKSEHPAVNYAQELTPNLPFISCSPVHIKKCLMNLAINATEAIENQGTVSITTSIESIKAIENHSSGLDEGNYAVLRVSDDGPGISKDDLKNIFEPFYTRKSIGRSGTGLGLTVVWNTVADHDGKILVESSDSGTTFQLYFPLYSGENIEPRLPAKRTEKNGQQQRVLIVDDEALLRDIASEMLVYLGYIVDSVSSGEAAIDFIKKQPVDILIIDMIMEPGINGRKTYEEIIKIDPTVKAIIASGYSESKDIKETLHLGANGFIQKPYSLEDIASSIKAVLEDQVHLNHNSGS